MSRPENYGPPELYYNEIEAAKYTRNPRIIDMQKSLTERCIQLLDLEDSTSSLILDIGCGSGLSGEVITDHGHRWIGCDISSCMLNVARGREVRGDLVNVDIGDGLPFVAGCFDAAISVSTIQWLLYSNRNNERPVRRLRAFFCDLFKCLKRGSKAVLQYYTESEKQANLLHQEAVRAGFHAAVVEDNPHSIKAKKYFLLLGVGVIVEPPRGDNCFYEVSGEPPEKRRKHVSVKGSKEWILKKKEKARTHQKEIPRDSKYTGRKRNRPRF